jgi:hypothetical protein
MPRVTSYGGTRVDRAAIPNARLTNVPSPDGFGAEVGRVARQLGQQALNVAGQEIELERERADELAVLSARNQYDADENDALFNKETGALMTEGERAFAVTQPTLDRLEKSASNIEGRLQSPRQKLLWARFRTQRSSAVREQLDRHTANEFQKYDRAETTKAIENAQQRAVQAIEAGIDNPSAAARVDTAMNEAVEATEAFVRRSGMGQQAATDAKRKVRTATYEMVITKLLGVNANAAEAFYESVKDEDVDQGRFTEIAKMVKAGTVEQNGERAAGEVWKELGPKDDHEPISPDVMEDKLRERFGDDVDTFKAATRALRSRVQAVEAGRKDRLDHASEVVWGAVFEGATLSSLKNLDEFNRDPKLQIQVRTYMENRANTIASRQAAEAARAASASGRAYTEMMRRDALQERAGWARMYDLSDPKKLNAMSRGEILALQGELGHEHVGRLLREKEELSKSTTAVTTVTLDRDILRNTALELGIDPDSKNEGERARLGRLSEAIKLEISRTQSATGKRLTYEETEALAKSVTDKTVMVDGWWSDYASATAVMNENDRKNAYVPIAEVPQSAKAAFANYLRSTKPAFANLSDAAIYARARGSIERAYAAKKLDMGIEEEKKRLGEAR